MSEGWISTTTVNLDRPTSRLRKYEERPYVNGRLEHRESITVERTLTMILSEHARTIPGSEA